MARVIFPDYLLSSTNGVREISVDCKSYRDLVEELEARWPGITDVLTKVAVAIDGQIYQDAWFESIGPTTEVCFMQRIEGG